MNREDAAALLQRLDAIPGIPGFEAQVGEQIARELAGCCEEQPTDALGSRLFIRRGQGEGALLLFAQMDEPGWLVSDLSPSGRVYARPVGRHAPPPGFPDYILHTAAGPLAAVRCGEGQQVPPRYPEQAFLLQLDIGARSRRGAQNRGAAVGDPVSLGRAGRLLGKSLFTGRAVESRAACAALVLTLRLLAGSPAGCTVIACAAAQGELDARGLRAAIRDTGPQLALGFSACPGAQGEEGGPLSGGGPAIRLCGMPPFLRQTLFELSHRRHIPCQPEVGAPPLCAGLPLPAGEVGIPLREYGGPHAPAAAVDCGDILAAAQLAAAFIQEADALSCERLRHSLKKR